MRDKYEPKWVESFWYQHWTDKKYFSPNVDEALENPLKKRFTMLVPPPSYYFKIRCHG